MGTLELIMGRLDEIAADTRFIKKRLKLQPDVVTVRDICAEMDISRAQAYAKKWLIPRFGEADYTGNPTRWDRGTWDAWKAIPEHERRQAWMNPEGREDFLRVFMLRLTT